jgi:hypothetical protein
MGYIESDKAKREKPFRINSPLNVILAKVVTSSKQIITKNEPA